MLQSPAGLLARLATHGRALSTSVLNQAVSSATTFALTFLLVRALSPAQYGTFGIGLSICFLFSGFGNALFLTQMVVHLPDRLVPERAPYAARVLVMTAGFCAGAALLASAAALVTAAWLPAARPHVGLALAVAAAAIGFHLRDYFVRQAYTARVETRALAVTGTAAVTMLALLGGLSAASVAMTTERALVVFGAAQGAGASAGLVLARLPLRTVTWSATTRDLAECWQGGRWAIGGVSITWIQSQAYAYAAIGILGSAGLGRANAARLLVAPFLLLVPALNQVTMPRLAEIRARDPGAMIRKGRALTTVLVCLALAYSGVLVALAGSIAPAVLGPRYTGMRPLVAAWCVVLVASVLRDGAGTILQVRKEFRSLTLLNGISAAIATAAAVALIATCSVPGAVLGTAAGELALGALLWRKIRHANG